MPQLLDTNLSSLREISTAQIKSLFENQRKNELAIGRTSAKERIAKLNKLHEVLLRRKQDIRDAMFNEFRKPAAEVDLIELYVLVADIKLVINKLSYWMEKKYVATPMSMLGSSSWIKYEPKGVCLIIAPWNFPLQLAIGPLISAIAAGNTVILKPSEHTPLVSKLIESILGEVFAVDEVAVVSGGVGITTELLKLPFNHIFFTGSPQVGKIVMTAAAQNLTSVTLELGGKSPNIVDETADIDTAAKRTTLVKYTNNGQICLAPDYILVHEKVKDTFIAKVKEYITTFYGDNPANSPDYCRMVNANHFQRVKGYLDEAVSNGAKIEVGGITDETQDYIAPTVVTQVSPQSDLMQNEIFGPIMPIISFSSIKEAIDIINNGERPLGLYIYSKSQKNIDTIMNNTRAGGTCINNSGVHFYNNNLPFGGVNNSGIGKSNGWFGFETFSNARGVLRQNMPGATDYLLPPFTGLKQKLIDFTIKYF